MKYILLIVLGLGLTLGSCKKFLQETPTGSLTDQSVITSYPGGLALATGAYRALPTWTNPAQWWGGNLMGALEYATGKAYSQYMAADLYKFETDVESGDSEYFIAPWNNWYMGVRDCNLAIKMIPGVTGMTAADKLKALGEVRTLRAFYYFCLVRHYGDVVFNKSVLTDVANASQPRTSLKAIYDKIIVPDLEFAVNESSLVDGKSVDGRITKYVARVIMADVYLTMAGYPYQEINADADTTKKWCENGLWTATTYPVNTASAKDLLGKAKVQLDFLYGMYNLGTYTDLNNPATNNNKGEGIFQVQYLGGTSNNNIVPCTLPITSGVSAYSDEYGTFIPSQAYHDSYAAADKRIVDRQFFYYSDTKAPKHDPNESPYPKLPIPFLYKYYDYAAVKTTGTSSLNLNLYRYADVLLMLTEVNWTLDQLGVAVSSAEQVKGINEVRARALLPGYPTASDLSLLKIMSERAYELIFESKMLFDMRRTRKVLKDGSGQFTALENFVGNQPVNYNFQFSAKHLLAPVSSTEIDNNRKCMQNFGWVPKQVGQ